MPSQVIKVNIPSSREIAIYAIMLIQHTEILMATYQNCIYQGVRLQSPLLRSMLHRPERAIFLDNKEDYYREHIA